ncbi:unnamed protein product [Urochloa decumbens]|uniref:Uncharacterized protein n=1 Tax=Urochloa decumbens TaxID=240449 RepID=A0ABC8W4P1_9POAL
MAKAMRMSSWLALALLAALLAVAAAEEAVSAPEAAADAPAAAAVAELEAAGDDVDATPAPAPAPASEEHHEKPSIGAKAKAGMQHMMDGLSETTAKLQCKIFGKCNDAPPAS